MLLRLRHIATTLFSPPAAAPVVAAPTPDFIYGEGVRDNHKALHIVYAEKQKDGGYLVKIRTGQATARGWHISDKPLPDYEQAVAQSKAERVIEETTAAWLRQQNIRDALFTKDDKALERLFPSPVKLHKQPHLAA